MISAPAGSTRWSRLISLIAPSSLVVMGLNRPQARNVQSKQLTCMMKMPQANRLHVRNVLQLDSYKIRSSGKSSTATFTPRRLAAKLRAAPDDHARSLRRSAPNRRCRPRDDPLTSVPAEPSRDNKKACARGENDM